MSRHAADRRGGGAWVLPPRFLGFLLGFGLLALGLVWAGWRWGQAVLGGFDLAALGFALSLLPLTRDQTASAIRAHAQANDANRLAVLLITALLMLVIVTALFVDLPKARGAQGLARALELGLVLASLVVAWVFSQLVYALHYAHLYYGQKAGGLNFPEQRENGAAFCPGFWDFVYFSATIGIAFAVSDVEITAPAIRRTAVVHGVAAFFYNLVVLAFTINVTAGG